MNSWLLMLVALSSPRQVPNAGNMSDAQAVYRVVLKDDRCSGRGSPSAKGDRPVLRQELVNPRQQFWWELPTGRPLAERLPSMIPALRRALLEEFLQSKSGPS